MNKVIDDIRTIRFPYLNGQQVVQTTDLILNDGDNKTTFLFVLPNLISLYLNIAKTAKEEARLLWDKIDFNSGLNDINKILDANNTKLLYDVFEKVIISITFSCFALESFSNQIIPSEFIDPYGNNKDYIEKKTNLETKLINLIPNVYSIERPSSQPFWSDICQLIKWRNDFVHLKSDEGIFPKKHLNLLLFSLKDFFQKDYLGRTYELMKFFASKIKENPKFNLHYMLPKEIEVNDWNWIINENDII